MPKEFQVLEIELQGKKLIEASAGTGKTFSVAFLALRLIVEKKIPMDKILLMTFTNAAVAEMEERIRIFIRQANAYLQGHTIENETIIEYFQKRSAAENAEASILLKDAMLELDQITVSTIHAFCSKTLMEYSFESDQIFGVEPIEDLNPVILNHVDIFWREQIATLPIEVLKKLIDKPFKKEDLQSLIISTLGGKRYYSFQESIPYNIRNYAKSFKEDAQEEWTKALINIIKCMAIQKIVPAIQKHLEDNNLVSFDRIIEKMEQAIHSEKGQVLKEQLRKKFKAVFIDEFQDTDKHQYGIFKAAFMDNNPEKHQTIVFLIADGKQLIYAFRKADIATYFRARNDIGSSEIYSMKENFRSSEKLIKSMNIFFTAVEDPFHFENEKNRLEYEEISFPKKASSKGEITGIDSPLTIFRTGDKKIFNAALITQMKDLLAADSSAYIPDASSPDGKRKIRPSDIGILVQNKFQAKDIKTLLATYKIPAVKIDDANVLESKDAKNMLNLLTAFVNRNPGNIRRALISSFTNLTPLTVQGIEMDKCSEQFRMYHDHFEKYGVYKSVMSFLKEYGVQHYLLFENRDERVYSNLIQILEILHEAETDKKLSPQDLVSWFKRMIDQKGNGLKIYEERMESDENAVKIITIHSSKGLEYPIVFNPFLDMNKWADKSKKGYAQFRDKNGEYLFMDVELLENDQEKSSLHKTQNEQENRRLIYVAMTRAKYACFIYSYKDKNKPSSLDPFVDALSSKERIEPIKCREENDPEMILLPPKNFYHLNLQDATPRSISYQGNFPKDNWWKMSYTRLSASHTVYREKMEPVNHENELDHFIFNQFPKGAKAGNILHGILERIDFTADKSSWYSTIQEILNFYRLQDHEQTIRLITEWIENILNINIHINGNHFSLNQIKPENRINEFEFDFKLQEFNTEHLMQLGKDFDISINPDLGSIKGIMNGKMDMFFRHGNKYYILDWKTNFLGYQTSAYDLTALESAMSENNYHLQYLLYTVAARLYLSSRVFSYDHEKDFGGVIYLFARGVRAHAKEGIFTSNPDISILDDIEKKIHEKQIH